jgi:hypothetical protein
MTFLQLHASTLTPPTHKSLASYLFPPIRYPISPLHLVCARLSPLPCLARCLALYRHPYLYISPSSRFIRYHKHLDAKTGLLTGIHGKQCPVSLHRHVTCYGWKSLKACLIDSNFWPLPRASAEASCHGVRDPASTSPLGIACHSMTMPYLHT